LSYGKVKGTNEQHFHTNMMKTPTKVDNKENECLLFDFSGAKYSQGDMKKSEKLGLSSFSKTQDFRTGFFSDVSNLTEDYNSYASRKSNSKIFAKVNNEKNKEVMKTMGTLMSVNSMFTLDFDCEDKVTDEGNINSNMMSPAPPGRMRKALSSLVGRKESMIEEEDGISPFLHLETKMGFKFKR
jgi:hypothetical protein